MSRTPPEAIGRLLAARSLRQLADTVANTPAVAVSGLWGSSVAAVAASLRRQLDRPVLLVCGHIDESDDLADDLELMAGARPQVLPALELAGTMGRISEEQVAKRLELLSDLAAAPQALEALVAPVQALMQSVPSPRQLQELRLILTPSQQLEPEKLIVWLADHGYNRLEQVEVPGDFAVRGGIIDIYLPGEYAESGDQLGLTVRVDFFDDVIESIRKFDLDTLGSGDRIGEVRLLDLKGKLPDTSESTHLFNYLPGNTIVLLVHPLEIAEQARSYLQRLPEASGIYPLQALLRNMSGFTRVQLSQFDEGNPSLLHDADVPRIALPIGSLQQFETEAAKALRELAELAQTHDVSVFCENDGEAQRLQELLDTQQPGLRERIDIPKGYLHRGFVWDPPRDGDGSAEVMRAARPLALLGHHELFHRYEVRRRVGKVIASRPVDSFLDLKVGDYVVHVAHGIARFMGMQTISKDGRAEEYLTLRFADNASLHVPAPRINLVQKYIGGFHGHPQLSRLGSGAWEKQKAKVAEAVMDLAAEMLEIQAARAAEQGLAYPPDTEWQKQFEAEFPYEPTTDQLTAASDIKQDMTRPRPMDRLLCGDVGYGKTEMAMRAAFKAVEYGKQVAVLVPTTVLAEQHYRSFSERMRSYPFRVESLSRFKSSGKQRQVVAELSKGQIDIVIGTHRLLSKDVRFADLGLVVVDEEQRFGVVHKERLKQMRRTVDVLTMSATPIPRTLHMSLLGLRDISSLTTAPQDRRSIVTEVMSYDPQRVKQSILRELNRDGQVYFVHNRVHNIVEIADQIHQLVPDARIIIGHGQMAEGELEKVMLQFINHEADILVCTTIIESGLDIPNVNTIIINHADRFGLSELHQLRGRVGRWKHRAYCYLLVPNDRPVTPIAAKRLKAIEEYSHLGAGFKIAMRDLEIRGAGNILGPEQSGHIATVGYEMYCQLLEEATRQLKNEPKPTLPQTHVDIGLSAFLPSQYIPVDRQRLDIYRRLTRCTDVPMLEALQKDVADAFGELPRQALLLFALTELRLLAGLFGIESIVKQPPDVVLTVRDAAAAQAGLVGAPGTLRLVDEKTVYLRPPATYLEPDMLLMALRNLLRQAYDRQQRGEAAPEFKAPAPPPKEELRGSGVRVGPTIGRRETKPAAPTAPALSPQIASQLEKLASLRDAGILTPGEFEAAKNRLLSK